MPTDKPSAQEIARERDEIRRSIVESLRLIVQSQYVLADLQENQRRLEQLLAALTDHTEDAHGHPAKAANEEDNSTGVPPVDP
jgi:hypothetical protein